ncbi:MAG: hypothetical protein HW400_164 [Candidatus Levybacteria bacterium]|nr:hypothetical protein [Candidatus Levybacteria bacterium]
MIKPEYDGYQDLPFERIMKKIWRDMPKPNGPETNKILRFFGIRKPERLQPKARV